MRKVEFKSRIEEHFSAIALEHGFQSVESYDVDFVRQPSKEIWHLISFSQLTSRENFDVLVMVTSPMIDFDFERNFPDSLVIPNAPDCYLTDGYGIEHQELFPCSSVDQLDAVWRSVVGPAIRSTALPYLDGIKSIEEYLPFLKHDRFLGPALHYLGRRDEARKVLARELLRLRSLTRDKSGLVERSIEHFGKLLAEC